MGVLLGTALVGLLIVGGIVALLYGLYVLKFRYHTVNSNEILVVTGHKLTGDNVFTENGRSIKIIRGGGYRLRMLQTARKASLHSFQIQLNTPTTVRVKGGIPIIAKAVATVKVADELEHVVKYAEQYMGKKPKEIEAEITNVLNTNLRAILAKLTVEEINNDRESFSQQVQDIAEVELLKMGFTLTSFGLEDVTDEGENGYLANLGRPKLAEMKKLAEIAESDAERSIRIHKAENDKQSKEEELKRQMEIAEFEKENELLIQKNLAETKREQAITEQVYELEKAKKQKEVEQKNLEIELLKKEELLKQEEVNKRKAIIEAEREAEETRIRAEAEKQRTILEGQAQAETYKAQEQANYEAMLERGKVEAEVILQKGKAEAESKKLMAQAIKEYGEVAVIEMIIKTMPEVAEKFADAYKNVDEIKIIDMGNGDGGNGVNKLSNSLVQNMTSVQTALEESTGIDLKHLMETFASRGLNLSNTEVVKENVTEQPLETTEVTELEQEPTNIE